MPIKNDLTARLKVVLSRSLEYRVFFQQPARDKAESSTFRKLTEELVAGGLGFRFQAKGRSMLPTILDGEILHVLPVNTAKLKVGDIVLFQHREELKAHRIIRKSGAEEFAMRGDASMKIDGLIRGEQIVGKIVAKECAEGGRMIPLQGPAARMRFLASETRGRVTRKIRGLNLPALKPWTLHSLLLLTMMVVPLAAWGQGGVALDTTTSGNFVDSAANNSNTNFTLSHTTNSQTDLLLVVGVDMNIAGGNAGTTVTGITYNGVALTKSIGFDNGTTNRAELWYLVNPSVGTFSTVTTVHKTGGSKAGVVIGAQTLYRVDQSSPISATATNTGSSTSPSVTIASAVNDGVLATLAAPQNVGGVEVTVTFPANQPVLGSGGQTWNQTSGTTGQDVRGTGSIGAGAASVTMSETLSTSATWTMGAISIRAAFPLSVRVGSFSAAQTANGALLSWNTGGELHNLGFNVYRDVGGEKVRLNPSLIAGSALLMRDALEQHGAKTYGWIDRSPASGSLYWLEDVDLNGTRTMHGPVPVQSLASAPPAMARAATIQDLASLAQVATNASGTRVREAVAKPKSSAAAHNFGFQLASQPAVKIFVDHEGWYRVTQPQLLAAGLDPNVAARSLHLFAEGVEQAIRITGATSGFGPHAAIEFYGTAIDTPYSGQRVYWLAASGQPGKRIAAAPGAGTPGPQAQTFIQTLELKDRSTYFAALLRDDTDNFFGPLVSPAPETQTLNVLNAVPGQDTLTVVLQGVTQGQQHDITVTLNGATLGDVSFTGQQEGKAAFAIPAGVLANGANAITLTAQQGDNDLSLVDYMDLSFPHTFTAESDLLKFTADAGQSVTVSGFLHPPTRLIDITNPAQPLEVMYRTTIQNGSYLLEANVPWTSFGAHTLLALSDAALAIPAALAVHHPSNLHDQQTGAEAVMLTAPQFATQVRPLAALREGEGKSVAVVNVDDVYDEFNFGERTPYAIRDFLQTATVAWKNKPHYLLLAGDASLDPRNYLGFGFFDFVPTKIVITSELKTASDDWFSDFIGSGFATIATGRLPARTPDDAHTMVGKILSYSNGQAGSWTNQSLLVADTDDPSVSFSQAAQSVQKFLPQTMNVTDVFASTLGPGTARQDLLAGINAGQLLVNYNGHGSVEIWGSGLFDDTAASSLNNGNKLPVFVAMNCLNGFFHDVYTESLAESLMLAKNGGAVAVWASSGLTAPGPQFQMDQTLVQTLFAQPSTTLGDAVLFAKSGIGDQDVRKTFILFGDPLMRLKQPGNAVPIRVSKPQTAPRSDGE